MLFFISVESGDFHKTVFQGQIRKPTSVFSTEVGGMEIVSPVILLSHVRGQIAQAPPCCANQAYQTGLNGDSLPFEC